MAPIGDAQGTGMTDSRHGGHRSSRPAVAAPKWWNTLAFRLAVVINVAAIVVLGTFGYIDYRREEVAHIQPEIDRLREEARVLRVAWSQFADVEQFQRFLDQFCRQMSSAASPGHHIVLFDPMGRIAVRAHEHADPALEAKMVAAGRTDGTRFVHDRKPFVSVGLKTRDGTTICVAQSLAPVEQLLHVQRISRLLSMAILVALVFGVTTIALLVWVRDPLRELVAAVSAVGHRRFDVRVRPSGSSELRYLTRGINEMIQSLDRAERDRESGMKRAQEIQQALLPRDGFNVDGFDVGAVFLPTESVGGDLYDIVELPDGSSLLAVLDVSGHGVSAAMCTALLRTVLHHQASGSSELGRIVGAMNVELADAAPSGTFATCLLVRLAPGDGTVEYVSAGHDPAIVVKAGGQVEQMNSYNLVLGVDRKSRYAASRIMLNHDDRLYLYTDGIHEVFDRHNGVFGRQRLVELLAETSNLPLDEQLDTVVRGVQAFQSSDQFDDDVTLICARRK